MAMMVTGGKRRRQTVVDILKLYSILDTITVLGFESSDSRNVTSGNSVNEDTQQ